MRDGYLEWSVARTVFAVAEARSHSITAIPFGRREYVRGVFSVCAFSISWIEFFV